MVGGHNKGHKASISEASSPEPTTDDARTMRPYYECVFCKMGFTTAQALGGHMNIHRKDRDRTRHARMVLSVSGKPEEYSEGNGYKIPHPYHHRTYSQVSESLKNYSCCFPTSSSGGRDSRVDDMHRTYSQVSESLKNYSCCFPASSSGGRDSRLDDMGSRRQHELRLFGQELQLGLGMYFDGSSAVYEEEKRKDVDAEEELDLELRLGHQL